MGGNSRQEYLAAIQQRYHQSTREEKGLILQEFCAVCGYHHKHAIRLLNRRQKRPRRRPGRRPVYYSPELLTALKRIWLATDQMCSKKLVAAIPLWLPFYERAYEKLSDEVENQLLSISAATIDRLLAPTRAKTRPRGLYATKPGSLLRNQIPIRTHNWDISQPGFMEADTVAHCGNSLAGDFIWSLTLTDIHTGWTECRATWNNGATGVIQQIKNIEASLAFELIRLRRTIATMVPSSSTTTWCDNSPTTSRKLSSPDHDRTKKTTTPTWNRKTTATYDNYSDMTA